MAGRALPHAQKSGEYPDNLRRNGNGDMRLPYNPQQHIFQVLWFRNFAYLPGDLDFISRQKPSMEVKL